MTREISFSFEKENDKGVDMNTVEKYGKYVNISMVEKVRSSPW
jgi:hypothetical protein